MKEKVNPYSWNPLPADLPKKQKCKNCGQYMQLLKLNEHVAFYVHRGQQLGKCTFIAFRTSYLKNLHAFIMDKSQHLQDQIPKGEQENVKTAKSKV